MTTNTRIVDFLSLLGLLNPAEQFLICSIERSIQHQHDKIVRLRDEEGSSAANEIAVLRAEIAYSRTIQSDFLQEILDISPRIRNQRQRRAHQRNRHDGGAILHTITNTTRPQYVTAQELFTDSGLFFYLSFARHHSPSDPTP